MAEVEITVKVRYQITDDLDPAELIMLGDEAATVTIAAV
jgi:hypothetical protein